MYDKINYKVKQTTLKLNKTLLYYCWLLLLPHQQQTRFYEMCGISNQVDEHCDEEESICPICESTMTFDDVHQEILICDNEECSHEIDTEEDL